MDPANGRVFFVRPHSAFPKFSRTKPDDPDNVGKKPFRLLVTLITMISLTAVTHTKAQACKVVTGERARPDGIR